ncbi:MAG: hypothetical protein J0M04_15665 [Verrucomicrobia bacterium]|nr:hypothetical protein [Verrucomicrobiota bacterium]
MKSCLSLLFVLLVLTVVLVTGGSLFYLSMTSEFSRKDAPAAAAPSATTPAPAAPRAVPVPSPAPAPRSSPLPRPAPAPANPR